MMLGERSKHADHCYGMSFVGVDYDINAAKSPATALLQRGFLIGCQRESRMSI